MFSIMTEQNDFQKRILKRYFQLRKKYYPGEDINIYKKIAKKNWAYQSDVIYYHCEINKELFVELFLSHHLQSGQIADFHKDWIATGFKDDNSIPGMDMFGAPREHAKSTFFSLAAPL